MRDNLYTVDGFLDSFSVLALFVAGIGLKILLYESVQTVAFITFGEGLTAVFMKNLLEA